MYKGTYILFKQHKRHLYLMLYLCILIVDLFGSKYVHKEIPVFPGIPIQASFLASTQPLSSTCKLLQVHCLRLIRLRTFKYIPPMLRLWFLVLQYRTFPELSLQAAVVFEPDEILKVLSSLNFNLARESFLPHPPFLTPDFSNPSSLFH